MESLTSNPLGMLALASALVSALILVWYLVARPRLTRGTKIALLFGIGLFPIAAAGAGNISGFEATKDRVFCGSCHVMTPYQRDSENPTSNSLAARHARNPQFGEANCYYCHADYGMFGTIVTKLGGMRHVYEYIFHYRNMSLEEARATIHLRGRFRNSSCMQCHSTEVPAWLAVGDHRSSLEEVRNGTTSCASAGCHGPAHPFSKVKPGTPVAGGGPR